MLGVPASKATIIHGNLCVYNRHCISGVFYVPLLGVPVSRAITAANVILRAVVVVVVDLVTTGAIQLSAFILVFIFKA